MGLHLHELVRVAGIAVAAGELAAAIGVDSPGEGHARFGAVQKAVSGELEVFYLAFGFQQLALSSQFRDADKHPSIFVFCSPIVKGGLRCYLNPAQRASSED